MPDLLSILLLIATGQGVFTGAFLISQKTANKKTGLLLGLIFIAYSLQLFDFVLLNSKSGLEYPHLTFWSVPFNLTFGPLLFLYIKDYVSQEQPLRPRDFLHFIPFLAHLIFLAFTFYGKPADIKLEIIEALYRDYVNPDTPTSFNASFPLILYLQIGVYLRLSWRTLQRTKTSNVSRSWLKKLWFGTIAIVLFGFIQNLLLALNIPQQPTTGFVAATMAVIYIYYGAIAILKRQEVMFTSSREKYHYTNLKPSQRMELVNQLTVFMTEQKPFKNPELTLKILASQMDVPERHISEVINDQLNTNFKDFLNQLRVEEFKKELVNPEHSHLSMLGIAFECGFNSKTTFNTVFRKATGITPSAYRKQFEH